MSKLLTLFFMTCIIAVIHATLPPSKCCGDNEIMSCGSACDTTCATLNVPCPTSGKTTTMCRCKPGYARNDKKKCIPTKDCPKPKCSGPYEEYTCGSACDTKCETLNIPCPIINIKCTDLCRCKKGYARDCKNICIPEKKCPQKGCGGDMNAESAPCGDPCPITCDNRFQKNRKCPKICIKNGCVCKPGYVLNKDKKCILIKDCPLKCGENEVANNCPGYCTFDRDCGSLFGKIRDCPAPPADFPCVPRCECLEGYVRMDNACVPEAKCCSDPNSELVNCPAPCEATCAGKPDPDCNVECLGKRCNCKAGYLKNEDKCILPKECPCGAYEVYSECAPDTPETCENRTPCDNCSKPGCVCQPGYIRSAIGGQCITPEECPECPATK